MKRTQYTPEFKVEAVKQVVDKGHSVVDVAKRLGIAEGLLFCIPGSESRHNQNSHWLVPPGATRQSTQA